MNLVGYVTRNPLSLQRRRCSVEVRGKLKLLAYLHDTVAIQQVLVTRVSVRRRSPGLPAAHGRGAAYGMIYPAVPPGTRTEKA